MRVLVACEYSGIVRDAFSKKGHDAWSCDLLPTESELTKKENKHIQGNVLDILNDGWDLMIGHPVCTYLCRNRGRLNKIEGKQKELIEAADFFLSLWNAEVPKICLENPVMNKEAYQLLNNRKYDQIIQPWQFGHDYSKKTCLWLKDLPKLIPTKIVEVTYIITPNGKKYTAGWYKMPRNSIARSRTFQGIAQAMADQWG